MAEINFLRRRLSETDRLQEQLICVGYRSMRMNGVSPFNLTNLCRFGNELINLHIFVCSKLFLGSLTNIIICSSSKFFSMFTFSSFYRTYISPIHQFPFSQFTFSIFLIPSLLIFLLRFQKMTSPTSLSSQTMFFPRRAFMLPVLSSRITVLYSKIFQHNFTIVPFLIPLSSRFFTIPFLSFYRSKSTFLFELLFS